MAWDLLGVQITPIVGSQLVCTENVTFLLVDLSKIIVQSIYTSGIEYCNGMGVTVTFQRMSNWVSLLSCDEVLKLDCVW